MLQARPSLRLLSRNTSFSSSCSSDSIPLYLCPVPLSRRSPQAPKARRLGRQQSTSPQKRCLHVQRRVLQDIRSVPLPSLTESGDTTQRYPPSTAGKRLPASCPGCGALTQATYPDEAGFYNVSRKAIKEYLSHNGLARGSVEPGPAIAPPTLAPLSKDEAPSPVPVCDRCHNLLHHSTGSSIAHPSLQSIEETIAESPHDHNHVYHVLDAADFPMSLVADLHQKLSLAPQRGKNRRAKTTKYSAGTRKTELSFIITRVDLLAPTKEQADKITPYLIEVLRDALGSKGQDVRLGNVRCVSAKRGWGTAALKEEVWGRGGGGWMVGKVNVGKSNLFESIFPKGLRKMTPDERIPATTHLPGMAGTLSSEDIKKSHDDDAETIAPPPEVTGAEPGQPLPLLSLLPPPQPSLPFPVMPIISSHPGTTASPIRIPFGNGRGELIDLPGLDRTPLDAHIDPHHRSALVMQTRPKPAQQVIHPGQSLLLGGGLVRITPHPHPHTADGSKPPVVIAYPFVPLQAHVTATHKALDIQTQARALPGHPAVTKPGAGTQIQPAGSFALAHDVTRQKAGPLARLLKKKKPEQQLPFRVLSTDILIEGVGWVELVAQVRRDVKKEEDEEDGAAPEEEEVAVTVYTPGGEGIAARRPLGAWGLFHADKAGEVGARPRRSLKGAKKVAKGRERARVRVGREGGG